MILLSAPLARVLTVQSVQQISLGQLKVTFSTPPRMNSASNPNDSLNIINYSLLGPNIVKVVGVTDVSGDPLSVFIFTDQPMTVGNWILSVANIQTSPGVKLTGNTNIAFTSLTAQQLSTAANGAQGFNSEVSIREYFSPALAGSNWSALLNSIAYSDSFLNTFAQDAFNQIFISTASGKYLDKRAANIGITRPPRVGIDDQSFRNLAISLNSNKLTLVAFLEVLQAYYGDDVIRASADTANFEPFSITDGSDIEFNITGNTLKVLFSNSDFENISQASALEVSAVINRYFRANGSLDFAKPIKNPLTGKTIIRVYAFARGLRGNVQITGGLAQNYLKFPTLLGTTQAAGTTWDITVQSASSILYSFVGGTNPDLALVHVGDYANIFGSVFNSNNRGSFQITDVTLTSFTITNTIGTAQAGVVQANASDILFFRPTNFTINSKNLTSFASVTQTGNTSDIILAATTQAVKRSPFTAAYLPTPIQFGLIAPQALASGSLVRSGGNLVTVTDNNHGLLTNDKVYLAKGEVNFPPGVKQITVTGANQFTYSETGSNVASSNAETFFPNFRDSNGNLYVTTNQSNGFANNQWVMLEGLSNQTETLGDIGFTATNGNSAGNDKLRGRQAVLLNNNKILITGGQNISFVKTNVTYLYDIATNTFSSGPNMNAARSFHSMIAMNDGRVMVFGGGNQVSEIYYPSLNIFVNSASNIHSRTNTASCLLKDGRILAAGGGNGVGYETFDPTTDTWTAGSATFPYSELSDARAVLLNDGRVLVAGGGDHTPNTFNSAILYNPVNDTWRFTINSMSQATEDYEAILLNVGTSGKVYVIGGNVFNGITLHYDSLNNVQIFDPPTETWTSGPPLNQIRAEFGLAQIPSGKIIVYGGILVDTPPAACATVETLDYLHGTAWQTIDTLSDQESVIAVPFNNNNYVLFTAGLTVTTGNFDYLYIPQSSATVTNSGRINRFDSITVNTAHQFYLNTHEMLPPATLTTSHLDNTGLTVNAQVTAFKALVNTQAIGPYLWDPKEGVNITNAQTTLNQTINMGASYKTITVNTLPANFPTSGYLVFNFGYATQTGPVQYFAVASPTSLIIDSSFVFPFNLPTNVTVIVLNGKNSQAPINAINLGSFYLTDSSAGRIAAQSTISDISGVGLSINIIVDYPGTWGLGNTQIPTITTNQGKINDAVWIWGQEQDIVNARNGAV